MIGAVRIVHGCEWELVVRIRDRHADTATIPMARRRSDPTPSAGDGKHIVIRGHPGGLDPRSSPGSSGVWTVGFGWEPVTFDRYPPAGGFVDTALNAKTEVQPAPLPAP